MQKSSASLGIAPNLGIAEFSDELCNLKILVLSLVQTAGLNGGKTTSAGNSGLEISG